MTSSDQCCSSSSLTGLLASVSGRLDEGLFTGEGQNFIDEFVAVLGVSPDEGTAVENRSFHMAARCVRVLVETGRGVAVPRAEGQTVVSSFDTCRCTNGFCGDAPRSDVSDVGILPIGHDGSYFDGQPLGEKGVQGTLGVGMSPMADDALSGLVTFGVDGTV